MISYIFLGTAAVLAVCLCIYMYARTAKILKSLEEMLDCAMSGDFSETRFTGEKLSKIESKMQRYLAAGRIERERVVSERNAVKALVSDISHQTKTQISNILLYTQLLREMMSDGGDFDGEALRDGASEHSLKNGRMDRVLGQIEGQAEKLSFLIQSLVKVSRLENGIVSVIPKENSVRRLLESADGEAAAQKKGIRFVQEDVQDVTAVFDLKWTSEALANIIDNAVKYTPTGGTITVSAKEYEMFVCIEIEDTGIGMTEEETAKIFARFYRSPAVNDEKGVGIGLYLVREILSQESGYVKVRSEPGKGSVFSVFLPKKL